MKPRRIPDLREGNVNLTPLIDVVLCLVIFFMIAAKIGVSGGTDPSIRLPITELGHDLATHSNVLILNVVPSSDSSIPIITALVDHSERDPQRIALIDPKNKTNPLEQVLHRLQVQNPAMKVAIRGDANMPYADLQPVLQACARAGVISVDFSTRKR